MDGTVGNVPSESDPSGMAVPSVPYQGQSVPSAFSDDYTAGAVGNYPNAGMSATAAVVADGVAAVGPSLAAYMGQAHAFITENGAQVLGGHTPVNAEPSVVDGEATGNVFDAG